MEIVGLGIFLNKKEYHYLDEIEPRTSNSNIIVPTIRPTTHHGKIEVVAIT